MASLNSNVSSVNGEIQTLQTQYTKAKNSLDLYKTLENKQGIGESLSRDSAKKLLDRLKEEYLLSSLSLTLTPTVEIKDSPVSTKTATLVSSEVTLRFDGMSDEQIFSFVNAISKEFTGYLRFTRFELTRNKEVTTDVLRSIGKGERPALVSGELSFKWFGLKANEKAESTPPVGDPAASQPAAGG